MTNETVYKATLDDDEILAALKRIEERFETVAQEGDKAFNGAAGGAAKAGVQIGIASGLTQELVGRLFDLGRQALETFGQIVQGSANVARQNEITRASLVGIFQGSTEQASAAFDFIREESRRLGVDLSQIAPAFLPRVENLEQFSRIAELIAGLANLDPEQGQAGARLALTEALSGDVLSLRRRFEIDTDPIREAQEEFGELEGLIVGLDQILAARGQNFEQFANTATANLGRVRQFGVDLQDQLGQPILEVFNEALIRLNSLLQENETDFQLIAGAIGDVVALGTELVTSGIFDFAEGLDTERILDFIQEAGAFLDLLSSVGQSLAASGQLVANFFDLLDGSVGTFTSFNEASSEAGVELFNLNKAFRAALQLVGLFNAAIAGSSAIASTFIGNLDELIKGERSFAEIAGEAAERGRAAAQEQIQQTNELLAQNEEVQRSFEEREAARREAAEASSEAGRQNVDDTLSAERATEELAEAQRELAEAQAEVNAEREKFDTEQERRAAELALKQERELLDLQVRFAQQREDLARRNAERVADILTRNQQRITDASRDLARDEQDILRNNVRQREDIERESAQRRVEIEEDFRRELERIRARFDFDAQEAIRANDAIAFLSAQRRRDFEIAQAQSGRRENISEVGQSGRQRREELNRELQRELQDARIANRRKLEDLQTSLQRELEAQRVNFARDLQEQTIAEQRKREALRLSQERQKQDFDRFWQNRLADLQRNLQRELELIQQAEQRRRSIERRANRTGPQRSGTNESDDEEETEERGTQGVRAQARHFGGPINEGGAFRLQRDEVMVRAPFNGQVIPVNDLMMGAQRTMRQSVLNQNSVNFAPNVQRQLGQADLQGLQRLFEQWLLETFQS